MKTKKTKSKLCLARIDSIGVSKVYNTGNYTNVKYELHAAPEPGDDAAAVLKELVYIIQMLRPLYKPDCFDSFTRAIKKTEEEQSAYERENLPARDGAPEVGKGLHGFEPAGFAQFVLFDGVAPGRQGEMGG